MTRQNDPLAGLKRPDWKLVKVNGFEIRNRYPDWDVVETSSSVNKDPLAPHVIPPNEAWIDQRFWPEREQLLDTHWREVELKKLGWARQRIRNFINRDLPKTAPRAKFVVREEKWHDLKICYVAGEIVRATFDGEFVFGGHRFVPYNYIPPNEIWIDICQHPLEVKYVLLHELFERQLMAKGMRYNRAHALATKAEMQLRKLDCDPPLYCI